MDRAGSSAVVVAPVAASERPAVALLAARAMRDNPMHVAALGSSTDRQVEVMRRAFTAVLSGETREVLAAHVDGRMVGVTAHTSSRHCQPGVGGMVRFLPAAASAGTSTPRLLWWLAAWGSHDPREPHSHLGPVAVESGLRGRGIGSALLTRYVEILDERGEVGYLETDRLANVRFYRRFGFEVVAEARVLRVPNWFMVRTGPLRERCDAGRGSVAAAGPALQGEV